MTTANPFDSLNLRANRVRNYLRRGDVSAALIEIDRLISEAGMLALLHRTEPLPIEVDG